MSESNHTLSILLAQTALGDKRAFHALYETTSPQIMGLLMSMLRRRDLAEDLLQDTYVKVWHRAGDYHAQRGQVSTWIASIARYAAIDLLRSEAIRRPASDDTDSAVDPLASASRALVEDEDQSRLLECLDALSSDQRQTISLAFYRGYTHEELALQLATPLGTVKAWIRRGLNRLRECLDT